MDIEVSPAESAGSQRQSPAPRRHGVARRSLLGVGIGGAAAAVLPAMVRRAGASTPTPPNTDETDETTGPRAGGVGQGGDGGSNGTLVVTQSSSAEQATTTTAPPKRPTDDDVPLLNFAQSAELAAYELYKTALGGNLDEVQRSVIEVISQGHLAYGQALSGLMGRIADNRANEELVDGQMSGFGGNTGAMLEAAGTLESTLVATHVSIIGELIGTDAATLLASIVTIEARNGTVLAALGGATDLSALLVDEEADALAPAGA